MSDNQIRHAVAIIITLICVLSYVTGYYAGPRGWWWTVLAIFVVYGAVYKIIDK
jgi:hypothetical protein